MSAVLTFYAGVFVGLGLAICTRELAQRGREIDQVVAERRKMLEALEAEAHEAETYRWQGTRVPPEHFIDYQSLS